MTIAGWKSAIHLAGSPAGRMVGFHASMSIVLMVLAVGIIGFIGYWSVARTACEARVPFDGAALPQDDVQRALERIGCTIERSSVHEISGLIPMSGMSWGQRVTVRHEGTQIVVRSEFTGTQAFGRSTNQENVDGFVKQWGQREKFAHPSEEEQKERMVVVTLNAARTRNRGIFMTIAATALLLLVMLVPGQPGTSAGNKFRLMGLALPVLAIGISSWVSGVKRLRAKRRF